MAFPIPPYTDGQIHTEGAFTYTYSAATGAWLKPAASAGGVPTTRLVTGVNSVSGGGDLSADRTLQLSGDVATPTANQYYGTNSTGVKGWHTISPVQTSYTVQGVLSLTGGGTLTGTGRTFQLVNDVATPGASRYYGTDATGTRGWYAAPAYVPDTRRLDTIHSLTGGGDLTADRTITLVNDVAAPGTRKFYGTDINGVRGWYDAPQPIQYYSGAITSSAYSAGDYVVLPTTGAVGITVASSARPTGGTITLTAGRNYMINFSLIGGGATAVNPTLTPMAVMNRTTNTAIVASFVGHCQLVFSPTVTTGIGFRLNTGGTPLSAATGTVTVYSID